MIDLHYWPTPNGHKITIVLEESSAPYRILPVNIGAGDQFKPEFLTKPVMDEKSRAILSGQSAQTVRKSPG